MDVSGYLAPVRTMIIKLLLLAAMLFMPLGMAPASAAVPQHAAMAGMAMGHCPDQPPQKHGNSGFAECTMVCSAAVPALGASVVRGPYLMVCEPASPDVAQRLRGLDPETAKPPPKRS